jgi:hypothetical protein
MDGQSVGLINFNRASLSVFHCTAVTAVVQFRAKTFALWPVTKLKTVVAQLTSNPSCVKNN